MLSLFDCNFFFPLLGFFSGTIQSLFWFVLKLFLIKFENITGRAHEKSISYSENHEYNGESSFSASHFLIFFFFFFPYILGFGYAALKNVLLIMDSLLQAKAEILNKEKYSNHRDV